MAEAKTKPAAPKATAAQPAAANKSTAPAAAPKAAEKAAPPKPVEKKAAEPVKAAEPQKAAAPKKAATPKKAAAPKKAPAAKKVVAAPGAEERYRMIEVAAYYVAERNGFAGDPKEFWAEAEAQIERMFSK